MTEPTHVVGTVMIVAARKLVVVTNNCPSLTCAGTVVLVE